MQRQAATPRGLGRRIRDLGFEKVGDQRMTAKVTYPLPMILTALVVGMSTNARSLRAVEQRTKQVAKKHAKWMGIKRRIADNTFGDILPWLVVGELVTCMHRGVKAEARRGNLKPTVLPVGTIAIDGKNVATLRWHDLCRKLISSHLWQHDLSEQGWLNWSHARQLVRVQRTEEDLNTGQKKTGNRFSVCNRAPTQLRPKGCLKISRAHWRCENETHWTADAESHEDRRRLAWSRHPRGVFAVSVLRRIAVNIQAVARRLGRLGHSLETPTWQDVADHFFLTLCASILQTEAFDAVE